MFMPMQKQMRPEERILTDGKTTAEPLRFEPSPVVEEEASTSAVRPETTDSSREEISEQEAKSSERNDTATIFV